MIYDHVYIMLDFPITNQSISKRMSTSNSKHGSFRYENDENTYPKGRALMQMYRVVSQTKRGNYYIV